MTPTLLLILDGWGIAPHDPEADKGDAPLIAVTPNIDALLKKYPHSRLTASGRAVGLPEGYMGNSEVGHLNIGAGRVVYQDMTRIDISLEDGSFQANPVLTDLISRVKRSGGR
ncbi:MAG: 2,3-bisphosphoglycerate-independent phosphoglycerate mutase, partial [Desulfovibrio sp.]|nr:2,3-bisphosphoglycerate-independent phosphoglycerate mutase [Desulfovibrio sp.]